MSISIAADGSPGRLDEELKRPHHLVANLKRKERDAQAMAEAMAAETIQAVQSEIFGFTKDTNIYQPARAIAVPAFLFGEAA